MKFFQLIFIFIFFTSVSPLAFASLNLNVKIGKIIGSRLVEFNKTISTDYNKEIIISPEGIGNNIVLSLKKFSNVLVNGQKIHPVQVDMKIVDEMQKIIGRPQTVTSFYSKSANFAIQTSGVATDQKDLNVSLEFEENN